MQTETAASRRMLSVKMILHCLFLFFLLYIPAKSGLGQAIGPFWGLCAPISIIVEL